MVESTVDFIEHPSFHCGPICSSLSANSICHNLLWKFEPSIEYSFNMIDFTSFLFPCVSCRNSLLLWGRESSSCFLMMIGRNGGWDNQGPAWKLSYIQPASNPLYWCAGNPAPEIDCFLLPFKSLCRSYPASRHHWLVAPERYSSSLSEMQIKSLLRLPCQ